MPALRPFALVQLFAALTVFSNTLSAQSPDQRGALDRFRDSLAATSNADSVRGFRQNAKGAFQLTREGLRQLREAELGAQREPFDNALMTLDRALQANDNWPYPWFALGEVRMAMSTRHFPAKATARQHAGLTYRSAALEAYSRAVGADPTFLPAPERLAELVIGMTHRELPRQLVPPLTRSAAVAGVTPTVLLALARLHFGARRYAESIKALDRYRALGGDSSLAAIEHARALAALERWPEAVAEYRLGLEQMDTLGRAEYRTDLSWIAQEWELEQFDSLPVERVGPWIAQFFREREALELRAPDERLREHLRRWVYAHINYVILRPGDMPNQAEGIEARDYIDPFDWDSTRARVIMDLSDGIPRFATYKRTQWEVDDRGVLYLRHGEPFKRVHSVAGPPNESWMYNLADGPRIFHFLGSKALGTVAGTTLVASLPMDPEMLGIRGLLDSRYDGLEQRVAGIIVSARSKLELAALGREVIQAEVARNQKAIALGVSTDGFPLSFKRSLEAVVQVYGIGLGAGETRRVLGVFAVPGQAIAPQARTDGGSGLLYPVSIRLVAMDREHAVIRQLDTTRVFLSQDTLKKDQYLTGFVELPVPAGTFQVRALVTSPGLDAGASAGRDSITIPSSPRELVLSDLILGREGGLTWTYTGRRIALNPLNAFARGSNADLFYEAGGLTPGQSYQTTIAVRKASSKADAKPEVETTTAIAARSDYEQISQSIGLAQLKSGNYTLVVTVKEKASDRSVTRTQALNILEK